MEINEAITDDEIVACFPVIMELRPHIKTVEELVQKVQLQREMGYRLMYIKDKETNQIASICGIRITHYLFTGKTVYIDDLCTLPFARGNLKKINFNLNNYIFAFKVEVMEELYWIGQLNLRKMKNVI